MNNISEAFYCIAEYIGLVAGSPLNSHGGAIVCDVDDHWRVAVNAMPATVRVRYDDGAAGVDLEPYHIAVWFNGWPAGIINAAGGVIAAGALANESALIAAVKKAHEQVETGRVTGYHIETTAVH